MALALVVFFVCLSVASVAEVAHAVSIDTTFDDVANGTAVRTLDGFDSVNSSAQYVTSNFRYVSSPNGVTTNSTGASNYLLVPLGDTDQGVFHTLVYSASSNGDIFLGLDGVASGDEVRLDYSDTTASVHTFDGGSGPFSTYNFATTTNSTWHNVVFEWREGTSTLEVRVTFDGEKTPWISTYISNTEANVNFVTRMVRSASPNTITMDSFYLKSDDDCISCAEFGSGTATSWIESEAPTEGELLYASSSVSLYSTYYVDSNDVEDGATIRACQIWNSVKNLGGLGGPHGGDPTYHGTFCDQVFVFDSEHYILNDIAQINATGTIQVHHYILEESIIEAPWWQFWVADEVTSRTIAEDYSQFHVFAITDVGEMADLLDRYEQTQEARAIQEQNSGNFGIFDAALNFMPNLLRNKHPFAWPIQALEELKEASEATYATSTYSVELPLFQVLDHASSSTGFLNFEPTQNLGVSTTLQTSPFEDGCEFLDDVITVSTSTTACVGFRTLTSYALYLLTVLFIGVLMWKLLVVRSE